MKFFILLVLLVESCCGGEYQSGGTDGLIDGIIEKHWERLKREPLWLRSSRAFSHGRHHKHINFACDHDEHISKRVKQVFNDSVNTITRRKRQATYYPPPPPQEDTYSPIRINIIDFISSTDADSCHTLNQMVYVENMWFNVTDTYRWYCGPNDLLDASKRTFFKNYLIPNVVEIIEKTILVKRVVGNLKLSSEYHNNYAFCRNYSYEIPQTLLDTGYGVVDADYIIWVSARPNPRTSSGSFQLANASPCSHYTLNGTWLSRPYAGWINFNPAALYELKGDTFQLSDIDNKFLYTQYVKVGLHEFMHALGFSASLFWSFVDQNGQFYSLRSQFKNYGPLIQQYTRDSQGNRGPIRFKMATPKVVSLARSHYDCATIDGLELEELDTSGEGPGSHWEKRVIGSELMSAVSSPVTIFSSFTLALLEDSGWYKVDYNMSERFRYGWKKGCTWAAYPCTISSWKDDFCSYSGAPNRCDPERLGRSSCTIRQTTYYAFDNYYQHLPVAAYGGKPNPDYCPLFEPYDNYYCQDPSVLSGTLLGRNTLGESFGANSWCFDISSNDRVGCFEVKCIMNSQTNQTQLAIKVGELWYGCPQVAGYKTVGKFNLLCPDLSWFCEDVQPVQWTLNIAVQGKADMTILFYSLLFLIFQMNVD